MESMFSPVKLAVGAGVGLLVLFLLITVVFKASDNSVNQPGSVSPWQEQQQIMREAMQMAREARQMQRQDMLLRQREIEAMEGGYGYDEYDEYGY